MISDMNVHSHTAWKFLSGYNDLYFPAKTFNDKSLKTIFNNTLNVVML